MENSSIYIVEDMGITRAAIISVLRKQGYLIAGSAISAEKALLEIKSNHVDLVILDLNLRGSKNGLWLAEKLRVECNCAIVFLTAQGSQEVLDKIYLTEPDGYLMKPFNNPTLLSTVKVALRNFHKQYPQINRVKEKSVFLKSRSGMIKVTNKNLVYLKSDNNYVQVHIASKVYEVREKLTELIKILDFENLYRIHRRYAVNAEKVELIEHTSLKIENGTLPCSKTFQVEELREVIKRL
jgi:DNA-binding LytR/AlgR family response regulator